MPEFFSSEFLDTLDNLISLKNDEFMENRGRILSTLLLPKSRVNIEENWTKASSWKCSFISHAWLVTDDSG